MKLTLTIQINITNFFKIINVANPKILIFVQIRN